MIVMNKIPNRVTGNIRDILMPLLVANHDYDSHPTMGWWTELNIELTPKEASELQYLPFVGVFRSA